MTTKKRPLDTIDAVLHEAALAEAEETKTTPRQKRIAALVKARVNGDLADMRRNLLPAVEPPVKARPVRPSLLVLGRDALIEKLEALTTRMGGAVQYAHRDLSVLSDDDLRRMIDLLDKTSHD